MIFSHSLLPANIFDHQYLIPSGLVDAHTGEVVKTWNGLQHHSIRAITGNENIGKEFVDIDVEKTGRYSCKHRDAKRRVEVS